MPHSHEHIPAFSSHRRQSSPSTPSSNRRLSLTLFIGRKSGSSPSTIPVTTTTTTTSAAAASAPLPEAVERAGSFSHASGTSKSRRLSKIFSNAFVSKTGRLPDSLGSTSSPRPPPASLLSSPSLPPSPSAPWISSQPPFPNEQGNGSLTSPSSSSSTANPLDRACPVDTSPGPRSSALSSVASGPGARCDALPPPDAFALSAASSSGPRASQLMDSAALGQSPSPALVGSEYASGEALSPPPPLPRTSFSPSSNIHNSAHQPAATLRTALADPLTSKQNPLDPLPSAAIPVPSSNSSLGVSGFASASSTDENNNSVPPTHSVELNVLQTSNKLPSPAESLNPEQHTATASYPCSLSLSRDSANSTRSSSDIPRQSSQENSECASSVSGNIVTELNTHSISPAFPHASSSTWASHSAAALSSHMTTNSKPDDVSTPTSSNVEVGAGTPGTSNGQNELHLSDLEAESPPQQEDTGSSPSPDLPPAEGLARDVQSLIITEGSPTPVPKPKDEDEYPYSIRLTPFIDHSSNTPALYISAVERKAIEGTVIKVGRYTERKEVPPPKPEHAPIVFKSKVVSRTHAQLYVKNGEWFIKDVKSSSGTFLNHVRLSLACEESQPYAIKDGDVLQLGMDFRGGSEEIYKCIKVRIQINKSWQSKANYFNVNALSNLRNICSLNAKDMQECAICLLPVSPCQALFIAPCSHAWHYQCIRPLVIKSYPHFLCPNCRCTWDLESEVETPDLTHVQQQIEAASGNVS